MIDENEKKSKPGAQPGNKNAAKEDGATSHIHIRVTPAEKASWVHAAGGEKLSYWVRSTLNSAAQS